MKKIFMILVAALMTVTAVFAQGKPVVVVVPFDAKNVSQDDVDIISEVFQAEYTSTGKATVVDRGSFDKIKAQQKFELSDWSDSAKVTELGKSLNAHQIITGQISQFGSQLVISIKLTDVKTTELLATTTKRVANMDLLFDECSKLAKDLSLKAAIPVEYPIGSKGPAGGTVYAVEGDWRWEVSEVIEDGKLGNYISNGYYQDWGAPNKDDIRLIETNLVNKGVFLPNKGMYYLREKSSGGFYTEEYYFQQGTSTSVWRGVRKFNVNDTAPHEPILGMWKGTINFNQIYWPKTNSGGAKYTSYYDSRNHTYYDTESKVKDAIENKFPLEVTLIINPDRTCKVHYYEVEVDQTISGEEKKNKEIVTENRVTASVNLKNMDKCRWEKINWGDDRYFYYVIYDEQGTKIGSFYTYHKYRDNQWIMNHNYPSSWVSGFNLESVGHFERTYYGNHYKHGFYTNREDFELGNIYVPIKKIQD